MEPRPPQPRSSHPFEPPGPPDTAGIGERLYPVPGEPVYYPGAEGYAPGAAAEPPLLPRRQRRQRGAVRGIAVTVVTIGGLVALGWFFRDAVRGFVVPPAPPPTTQAQLTAPGTPTVAPEAAAPANALATVTPTPELSAAATSEPDNGAEQDQSASSDGAAESGESSGDISSETLPLLELLPSQTQMPAGFVQTAEAERSNAEVVESLGGTEEASQLLDDWGWSGNAFRDYVADETAVAGGANFLNVSVHRFADAESAADALVVYSDQVIVGQGLQMVESPAIGDSAVLLVGSPDGAPVSVLYAQQGPIMYRIGGSTTGGEGDPTTDVLTVAEAIVTGQANGD